MAELRATGASVLAAWNRDVFCASMHLMSGCCRSVAARHGVALAYEGGIKMQRATGVVAVGVCADAVAAVTWALECQAAGLELPWWAALGRAGRRWAGW